MVPSRAYPNDYKWKGWKSICRLQKEYSTSLLMCVCVLLSHHVHWHYLSSTVDNLSFIHPSLHPSIRQASSILHSFILPTYTIHRPKPWNQPLWPLSSRSSAVVAEIQPFSNQLSNSKNNCWNQALESHLFLSESYALCSMDVNLHITTKAEFLTLGYTIGRFLSSQQSEVRIYTWSKNP